MRDLVLRRHDNARRAISRPIGVPILIACLVSAHLADGYLVEAPFKRVVEESSSDSGLGRELAPP